MKRIPCKKEDFIKLMSEEKISVQFISRERGLHQFSFPREVTIQQVTDALNKLNFRDWGATPHDLSGSYHTPGIINVNLKARFEV